MAQRFFRKIKDVCVIFIGIGILYLGYQVIFGTELAESKMEKETYVVIKSPIGEEHVPIEQYLVGLLAGSIDITYEEQPILGAFCAMSGGNTRLGEEIFDSKEYGYLESVVCEYDVTDAHYMENYYFTWKELQRKLSENKMGTVDAKN